MNARPSLPREVEGKYVLLVVFFLGLAGAGGGWLYHQRLQRRPLALWGSEAANLILRAPDVEFCRLKRASEGALSSQVIATNRETFETTDCHDAARIRGFLHLRHSLLNDFSFDWSDAATGKHDWQYVVRFRDGDQTATLLISADFNYVMLVEREATISVMPIAAGLKEVLAGR
jgi:hypothetical protein